MKPFYILNIQSKDRVSGSASDYVVQITPQLPQNIKHFKCKLEKFYMAPGPQIAILNDAGDDYRVLVESDGVTEVTSGAFYEHSDVHGIYLKNVTQPYSHGSNDRSNLIGVFSRTTNYTLNVDDIESRIVLDTVDPTEIIINNPVNNLLHIKYDILLNLDYTILDDTAGVTQPYVPVNYRNRDSFLVLKLEPIDLST